LTSYPIIFALKACIEPLPQVLNHHQIIATMKQQKTITKLVGCIIIVVAIVSAIGVFTNEGTGSYTYQSIRGQAVEIYEKGIYKEKYYQ
jgi:hypothetical protein